jgi:hypothetical protein
MLQVVLGHRRPCHAHVELQHRRAEAGIGAGQDGVVGEIDARIVVCPSPEDDAGRIVEAISIAEQHGRGTISRVDANQLILDHKQGVDAAILSYSDAIHAVQFIEFRIAVIHP